MVLNSAIVTATTTATGKIIRSVSEERRAADFEQGVMVDVGAGAGALILYLPEAMLGREIEISRHGQPDHTHTEVLKRKTAAGYVCAAVFGSLPEGDYELDHDTDVHITAGQVLELDCYDGTWKPSNGTFR